MAVMSCKKAKELMLARPRLNYQTSSLNGINIRGLALPFVDILSILGCVSAAGLINNSFHNFSDVRAIVLGLLVVGAVIIFQQLGHYNRRRQMWQEAGDVAAVLAGVVLLDAALLYLLKINFSRVWVISGWVLAAFAVPLVRFGFKRVCMSMGAWRQPTVIVGTGPLARETAMAHAGDVHMGYDIVAFVDPEMSVEQSDRNLHLSGKDIPVYARDPQTNELPTWLGRPHVIVALEINQIAEQEGLIERISLTHRDIDMISPVRGLPINNAKATHFFSYDILSLRISNNLARPWSQMLKRLFDIAGSAALIVMLGPLMLALAIKLKLEGGNVFFGHTRVGRNGQLFKCLKFRSMVHNSAEVLAKILSEDPAAREEWDKTYKLKNDPRITSFGHFIRKTSLDELPQLFNVLRGEMSLVGPRPVVPDELERYGDAKVYYLEVRPGLTGLWQISGRSDLDYEQRVNLDTWYVRNWTLWYDILILFKTVLVVPSKASGAY